MAREYLNDKEKMFVSTYLKTFNKTEAARAAGYAESGVCQRGYELYKRPQVKAEIERRLEEVNMGAMEVLIRLSEHARADIGDFMDITSVSAQLDLQKAKDLGLTHLIKKVKQRTTMSYNKDGEERENHYIEIELHDPQSALVQLGKHHKLFSDRIEVDLGEETRRTFDQKLVEIYGGKRDTSDSG